MVDIKPLKDQDPEKQPSAPKAEEAKVTVEEVKDTAPKEPVKTEAKSSGDNTDDLKQQNPDQKKAAVVPVKMSADELLSSRKYAVSIKQKRQRLSPLLLFPAIALVAILAVSVFGIAPEVDNVPEDNLEELRSESQARIKKNNQDAIERKERVDDNAAALEEAKKENEEAAKKAEEELAQLSERNNERKNDINDLQFELEKLFGETGFYPKFAVISSDDLPETQPEIYLSPDGERISDGSATDSNNDYFYQTSECDDQGCEKYELSVYLEPVGEDANPELYKKNSLN